MKKHMWKNILWGILFLAGAAFIVFTATGVIEHVDVLKIVFSVIFAGIIISSIPEMNFWGILFPLSFICIMFDKEWGIEELTPWPVIGIALLGSIGLSLIFSPVKKKLNQNKHCHYHKNDGSGRDHFDNEEVIIDDNGDVIRCETKFAGETKYIKSENLRAVEIINKFGGTNLYFDGCKVPSGQATIDLDCSCGGVELYFPKNWKVIRQVSYSFGAVEEKNFPDITPDSPEIYLTGSVNFSGVDIKYI